MNTQRYKIALIEKTKELDKLKLETVELRKLKSYKKRYDNLLKVNKVVNNTISNLNDVIKKYENEKITLLKEIEDLKADIQTLEAERLSLLAEIDALKTKLNN